MKIDILYLLMASFAVIGIIEWVKSVCVTIKAKDGSWKWPVASLVFSLVVAAFGDGGVFQVLTNFVIILAINEIVGYNMIVKTVFALIDKLVSGGNQISSVIQKVEFAAGGGGASEPPHAPIPAVPLSKGEP